MEHESVERGVWIERRGVGYAARGARFYVWDEDPRALLEAACAFARSAPTPKPLHPRPQRSRSAVGSRSR